MTWKASSTGSYQNSKAMRFKRSSITLLGILLLASCGRGKAASVQVPEAGVQAQTEVEVQVQPLTRTEFLKKVFDYKSSPDSWKYLGDKPAVIDFYATWCGPCRRLSPILERLAKEYSGKITVYKVDVDAEPELASVFGVRSIPSVLFIPMAGKPQMTVGLQPERTIRKTIDEFLLDGKR